MFQNGCTQKLTGASAHGFPDGLSKNWLFRDHYLVNWFKEHKKGWQNFKNWIPGYWLNRDFTVYKLPKIVEGHGQVVVLQLNILNLCTQTPLLRIFNKY